MATGNALIGVLFFFTIIHVILIVVPLANTLRAPISGQSKLAWCAFLVLLPFIGIAWFHFRFRSSLFRGKPYEPSAHELGARNWSDSPNDRD